MAKTMTEIFDRVVTDQVASGVHAYLIIFCVFATYVCVRGIRWESRGPLSVHSVAGKLVIWGVAIEAICTIALFVFDEVISFSQKEHIGAQQVIIRDQNEKIIALERRLAPRVISDAQKDEMTAKLKRFAGTEFDAATGMHDNEQTWLLSSLLEVLGKAEWRLVNWRYARGGISYGIGASGSPDIGDVATYDVEIQAPRDALNRLMPIAEALVLAIRAADIAAHASVADATTTNNANQQLLHVIVGQRR